MADVRWVKLAVDVFDNRKIRRLRSIPHGDETFIIWVYLLTLAGKCNAGGKTFITEDMPYTVDDIVLDLDYNEEIVKEALAYLVRLKMIHIDDGFISICGWEDHQNVEGMEKIREQNRARQQRFTEKHKQDNVSTNVSLTLDNATDKIREEEEKIREDKEKSITEEKAKPSPPPRHKYGEFQHVLLTDADLEKLKAEFTDWEERIQRLDEYIEMKGENYKNHYLTIKNWARRDSERGYSGKSAAGNQGKTGTDEGRVFGILI